MNLGPVPAIVVKAEESADEAEWRIVKSALECMGNSNWRVGQLAAEWLAATKKSDGEFGRCIGLSKQQVQARRSVWERFGDDTSLQELRDNLTWSHFREAVGWEDALDCLEWASECGATIAEMCAWRRAMRGETLFDTRIPATVIDAGDPAGANAVSEQATWVQIDSTDVVPFIEPAPADQADESTESQSDVPPVSMDDDEPSMAMAKRRRTQEDPDGDDDDPEYAPYSASAKKPKPASSGKSSDAEERLVSAFRAMELERVLDLLELAFDDRNALASAFQTRLQKLIMG